jgi:pectate lyase
MGKITVINHTEQLAHLLNNSGRQLERIITVKGEIGRSEMSEVNQIIQKQT